MSGPSRADEWQAISLNYTSGTTGRPKGVVYHHRGAHLNAVGNILTWGMPRHSVYLWTLPMFHCNGWCFPWTIAANAGTNVCLRKVDAAEIFRLMRAEGVTHYCGAPIVHNLLINAPGELREGIGRVSAMVAAAAPPGRDDRGHGAAGVRLDPRLWADRNLWARRGVRQAPGLGQPGRHGTGAAQQPAGCGTSSKTR